MTAPATFEARFFDGQSAAANALSATFDAAGVVIEGENIYQNWAYKDVSYLKDIRGEVRLTCRTALDAVLIAPLEAREPLALFAPDLVTGRRERRKFAGFVAVLIAATVLIAAGLFFGVPAASGPMAQATPKTLEAQIGANVAAQIQLLWRPCKSEAAYVLVRPVLDEMGEKGDVGFPLTFHFVRTPMPNAFTLPGGHVMATSGLLTALGDDQEAFLAVMAHELGHVRARDSMQAVYRNAGLSTALEVITGGTGLARQAILVGGQLNQLSHTRRQERAADEAAYDILTRAGLNPAALARAFEAIVGAHDIEEHEDNMPSWLSTHPDTADRIAAAKSRNRETKALPLTDVEWRAVLGACIKPDSEQTAFIN